MQGAFPYSHLEWKAHSWVCLALISTVKIIMENGRAVCVYIYILLFKLNMFKAVFLFKNINAPAGPGN